MKTEIKTIPEGIQYLSDWEDFKSLPQNEHYILNKDICGCGATEAFIRSNRPLIIAMPRKHLLFNKYSQHIGENIFLYRFKDQQQYFCDKEPTKEELIEFDRRFIEYLRNGGTKILATYDSLDKLTKLMKQEGVELSGYQVVVDEFQQIIGDAPFKANIEHQFYMALKKFNSVVYLSATPFLQTYLEMTDQFKGLLIIHLEWPERSIVRPKVNVIKLSTTITKKCCEIIRKYKIGDVPSEVVGDERIDSQEAVFFLNDVKSIINVITKSGLEPEEVNILCAPRKENYKRINKLNEGRSADKSMFTRGEIPGKGKEHKMFTFCTSTVYIGSDFYSPSAYTYIFSNPNVESLTIDVATDLQQIIGRQRLEENPFSRKADFYYYLKKPLLSEEEMGKIINQKRLKTREYIENYESAPHKESQLTAMEALIQKGHDSQYCCISKDSKGNKSIVENELIVIAEKRAWDISNKIYSGDLSFIKAIGNYVDVNEQIDSADPEVIKMYSEWSKDGRFDRKAKLYCDLRETKSELFNKCTFIETYFHRYYEALGRKGIEDLQWRSDYIRHALAPIPPDDMPHEKIVELLKQRFKEGNEYSQSEIKAAMINIYKQLGITGKPSASDIQRYFTIKKGSKRIKRKKTATIQILSYWQKKITLFSSITSVIRPCEESDIDRVLDMMRTGKAFNLINRISELRDTKDKALFDERKHNLPIATWNGIFSYRDANGCVLYASFTALDFDHVADLPAIESWLKTFSCVYAYFRTPSGNGIKAIILHDNRRKENHADLYDQLLKYFKCDVQDTSTSDLGRGNYLSHDPSLWRNPHPVPYHYEPSTIPLSHIDKTQTVVKESNGEEVLQEDDNTTTRFLRKLERMIISDESILNILRKQWNQMTITRGRNNTALSYAGVLCKAGVEQITAETFIAELIPTLPKTELTKAVNFAYGHNIFGLNRRRYIKNRQK